MEAQLGRAVVVFLVVFLFVNISQSALPNAVLGEPCQDDRMCQIPNSYCRPLSRSCECKSGHTHNNNKDNCIKLPQRAFIGDHCISDVDCTFTEEATRCSDNTCKRCTDGSEAEFSQCQEPIGGCAYHEYNGQCFKHRRLGEPCALSEECWIFPDSDKKRNCTSSICQCVEGYDAMSGPLPTGQVDQCIKQGGGGATSSTFSTLVSLIALLVFIVI